MKPQSVRVTRFLLAILVCAYSAAHQIPALGQLHGAQPSPAFPLYCQGPLHTNGTSTPFKWSSKGAAAQNPGAGQCAWADRGPRGTEIQNGDSNLISGDLNPCGTFPEIGAGKYFEVLVYRDVTKGNHLAAAQVVGFVQPPFRVDAPVPPPLPCTLPK
jgi:hypothetical protein